ncbi:MAG: hypothetical protein RLZZ360_679 [Candidatus Parcubacteria bacterium]|jgi:CubicO group peptidase (beta-lactamase class C family)
MDPKIDSLLDQAVAKNVFPGCNFAIVSAGSVAYKSFGNFTYETNAPRVTIDTIYDCASLTKIVGPMAVAMQLVDEGVLSLDEPVGKYLPEFVSEPQKAHATIGHLMTYTLDYDIPGGSKSLLGTLSPDQVAKNAIIYPLKHAPGINYMYSNITAFVLTQVIERAIGQNFYELVQERIFNPLLMHTATFNPSKEQMNTIQPTELTPERGLVQGTVHDEFTDRTTAGNISNGAAGLFASIKDIASFLQMTIESGKTSTKTFFSDHMVKAWTEEQFPNLLPILTPLGWGDQNNALLEKYHRQMVVKSGFTGCFMAGDLLNKKGFALLSNRTYPVRPMNATAFGEVKEKLMEVVFG